MHRQAPVNESIEFLRENGTTVVFLAVLLEQMGLPVPCTPWLLAAGALAHSGKPSLLAVIALAALGASLGHLVWFFAGRRWGFGVLRVLCRISIEPETCVQRTQGTFDRYGPGALVAAPFIPGLTTVAPPLAGLSGMSIRRYLLLDGLGDVIWASTFVGLGYVFGVQVTWLLRGALRYGSSILGVARGPVLPVAPLQAPPARTRPAKASRRAHPARRAPRAPATGLPPAGARLTLPARVAGGPPHAARSAPRLSRRASPTPWRNSAGPRAGPLL